jgi:uncharacterized membrane protein
VWLKPEPAPPAPPQAAKPAEVKYAEVQKVFETRCYMCHSGAAAMKGVQLDSPEQVKVHAQGMYQQAVLAKTMPLNNATGITDAERDLIGRWFQAGAKTE